MLFRSPLGDWAFKLINPPLPQPDFLAMLSTPKQVTGLSFFNSFRCYRSFKEVIITWTEPGFFLSNFGGLSIIKYIFLGENLTPFSYFNDCSPGAWDDRNEQY